MSCFTAVCDRSRVVTVDPFFQKVSLFLQQFNVFLNQQKNNSVCKRSDYSHSGVVPLNHLVQVGGEMLGLVNQLGMGGRGGRGNQAGSRS